MRRDTIERILRILPLSSILRQTLNFLDNSTRRMYHVYDVEVTKLGSNTVYRFSDFNMQPRDHADYDAGNIAGLSWSITVNQVRAKTTGTQSWHNVVVNNDSGSTVTATWEWAHRIVAVNVEGLVAGQVAYAHIIEKSKTVPTKIHGSDAHYYRRWGWMGKDGWSGLMEGRYEIYAYTSLEILEGADSILDEQVEEWSNEFNVP